MAPFGIRPEKLDVENIEEAAKQIRETFGGEILEIYEVLFEGMNLVRAGLYLDTEDERGGVVVKQERLSSSLALALKDEREGYNIRFETWDSVTLQWVGNSLIMRNGQRPLHDKKSVRELYIAIVQP